MFGQTQIGTLRKARNARFGLTNYRSPPNKGLSQRDHMEEKPTIPGQAVLTVVATAPIDAEALVFFHPAPGPGSYKKLTPPDQSEGYISVCIGLRNIKENL